MPDDVDPERRYHRVLSVVGHQTTPAQPPGVRPATITQLLAAHGPYAPAGIQRSLRAATGRDIVLWRDGDGEARATLRTEPDLQRAGRWAGERELVTSVATINQALAEVRDG